MSDPRLQLADPRLVTTEAPKLPFGRFLIEQGIISEADLTWALAQQNRHSAPIGELLVADGRADVTVMLRALALHFDAQLVDLTRDPPLPSMAKILPPDICQKHGIVPWAKIGDVLMIATDRPERFHRLQRQLDVSANKMIAVVASTTDIRRAITQLHGDTLAHRAATRVPDAESCRRAGTGGASRVIMAGIGALAVALLLITIPFWTFTVAMLFACATLMMTTTLKLTAAIATALGKDADHPAQSSLVAPLPRVSVLVPLFREKEIASALIKRLSKLTYPKSLLEVVLVLEDGDQMTRDTIARTDLPPWMSVVEVPEGDGLKTKPRAMNYALDFCRGDIVGVWDAEDAPEPDQIEKVAARFQHAPDNLACLQGILDYYNPRANWLARCFTIEYATWWRMIQKGQARLGLVVPLGGTTLFFRRDILEELNGWDAHNVTEDADLGVRLARHGYVTEMIATTTFEEANCRLWPWVRQRSRWLKGFMITWRVHMRHPLRLLHELGLKRWLGIQTIFLATVAQFACAPLLWSFWITLFGITHPIEVTLGQTTMWGLITFFILAEIINQTISLIAVSGARHRHLMKWVPTTLLYYPLGALAAYKALTELIRHPFYWDKTQHGVSHAQNEAG